MTCLIRNFNFSKSEKLKATFKKKKLNKTTLNISSFQN